MAGECFLDGVVATGSGKRYARRAPRVPARRYGRSGERRVCGAHRRCDGSGMSELTPDARRERAVRELERRRCFQAHVAFQVILLAVLAVVWAVSEYHNAGGWPTGLRTGRDAHDWDPWIVYPVIVAVAAIAIHAWHVFGRRPISEADIRRQIARCR